MSIIPSSTWNDRLKIVYECKHFWISYQEHDEMIKQISSWVPIPIMSCTFVKNVSSWFDRIVSTWTFEFFIREKP